MQRPYTCASCLNSSLLLVDGLASMCQYAVTLMYFNYLKDKQ